MSLSDRTGALQALLRSPVTESICQAHDGISARIVEEAGFPGIWASGLGISAALGVRDSNEASWTQVLEVVEFMSDASTLPILLDGDTGYGNFNNLRRLVRKLESREIAGVCIEDKLFPKTNSFINGSRQELADIDEFCGKIKAGKDTQRDDDFAIVARTEAFIVGAGLSEALRRAEAYRQAGADAILVHSKESSDEEIQLFMREWGDRSPIVIVPTTYFSTPRERFAAAGISLVIWANQLIRASVRAMQETATTLYRQQSLQRVEDTVVPVKEIFRLQGAQELQEAESRYLPGHRRQFKVVILAASRGDELGALTAELPKALLPIDGVPILERTVAELHSLDIRDISVVRGYGKQAVSSPHYRTFDNDDYATSGELGSLYQAREQIGGYCLIAYGDCLYRRFVLQSLLNHDSAATVVVDQSSRPGRRERDWAYCSKVNGRLQLRHISRQQADASGAGEWAGIVMLNPEGSLMARDLLRACHRRPDFHRLSLADFLNMLGELVAVDVCAVGGGWLNVNDVDDLLESPDLL